MCWDSASACVAIELREDQLALNEVIENIVTCLFEQAVILRSLAWHLCVQLLTVGGEVVVEFVDGNGLAVHGGGYPGDLAGMCGRQGREAKPEY